MQMMNFKKYLTEAKKQYKRGGLAHLSVMGHWANELAKLQNLPTPEDHSSSSRKWFEKTKSPYVASAGDWSVKTDNPSDKTSEADILASNKSGLKIGIEAKSGRPSLTSATLSSTFDIKPQSLIAKHLQDSLMGGRLKRLTGWLEAKQKQKPSEPGPHRRFLRMKKRQTEPYHPVVSEYETALHKSGVGVISITDGKGNIRHFSTNPEHEERLSKYVDVAHIQHKGGRLSLRIGQVTSGGQTRKETQGISFLSKQPVGYSVKQIVELMGKSTNK